MSALFIVRVQFPWVRQMGPWMNINWRALALKKEIKEKERLLDVRKLDFQLSPEKQVCSLKPPCGISEGGNNKKDHLERSKDSHEGLASPGAKSQL